MSIRSLRMARGWVAVIAMACVALPGAGRRGSARADDHPHIDRPACVAVASTPGAAAAAQEVVTGGDGNRVVHWKVAPVGKVGDYKKTHVKKVSYVAVSLQGSGPNPNKLFQANYDAHVFVSRLRDFGNNSVITDFAQHTKPAGVAADLEVWAVAPSMDGTLAASATNFGQIMVWETATGTLRGTIPGSPSFNPVGGLVFRPRPANQRKQFLAGHGDGNLRLYQLDPTGGGNFTLTPVRSYPHNNSQAVNAVAVTRSGAKAVYVEAWFAELDRLAAEPFMPEGRQQPPTPKRDVFDGDVPA